VDGQAFSDANGYYDVVVFNAKGQYVAFTNHSTAVAHMNNNLISRLSQAGEQVSGSQIRPFRAKTLTYVGSDPVNFSDYMSLDREFLVNE
jgi:hypothetical protein